MNARTTIKNILHSILPKKAFDKVRAAYIKHGAPLFNNNDNAVIEQYTTQLLAQSGYVVIEGPFKGLKYVTSAVGSSFVHKLAGYYEAVLIPYVEEVKKLNIQHILDIGSAEGYYTTGFGRIFPNASISAFEMDEQGRKLTQEMYTLNGLTNPLSIQSEANNTNIVPEIKDNTLLICDCEGAEKTILDIADKNLFSKIAYGIIELHDELVPGCKEAVNSYFKDTHSIEIVQFKMANPIDFSFLRNISNPQHVYTLLRERGIQNQEWAILRRN
ncbi:MAG: hypothetical protein V4576_00710 [Patescibacteria group bacterium]